MSTVRKAWLKTCQSAHVTNMYVPSRTVENPPLPSSLSSVKWSLSSLCFIIATVHNYSELWLCEIQELGSGGGQPVFELHVFEMSLWCPNIEIRARRWFFRAPQRFSWLSLYAMYRKIASTGVRAATRPPLCECALWLVACNECGKIWCAWCRCLLESSVFSAGATRVDDRAKGC